MSPSRRPGGGLSGLPLRITTAAAYGAVLLAVILFGRLPGLALLVAVLGVLASIEFFALTRRERRMPNEFFGLAAVAAMPLATAYWGRLGLLGVLTALILAALVWHVLFRQIRTADTATTLFGATYIGFALSHLVLIRSLDWGAELVLAAVVSVWANDVLAYLVGSTLGTHKMAPNISPNKSWEGFAAGTAGTLAIWILVWTTIGAGLTLGWAVLIGIAVALASVTGDLFESRLKREARVKDSGTLLPGHGGFLDRVDSLILVSVVAYYLLLMGGAR